MRKVTIIRVAIAVLVLAGSAVLMALQTPPLVRNPSVIGFLCPDHATDDQHELDIVRVSDGVVVQTLLLGDPPANAEGEVIANVNVQPVAFGRYRFVARAVAGAIKSDNSLPSPDWERAPGKPTNVVAR